jgi:hypothetical protein
MLHRPLSTIVAVCSVSSIAPVCSVVTMAVERVRRYVRIQRGDVKTSTTRSTLCSVVAHEFHAPVVTDQVASKTPVAAKRSRVRAGVRACLEGVRRRMWRRGARRMWRRRWIRRLQCVGVGQRTVLDVADWAVGGVGGIGTYSNLLTKAVRGKVCCTIRSVFALTVVGSGTRVVTNHSSATDVFSVTTQTDLRTQSHYD